MRKATASNSFSHIGIWPPRASQAIVAAIACALLTGCGPAANAPDNAAVCGAYRNGQSRVEVVATGHVSRTLGTRMGRTSPHEGFLVALDSGCRVTVRVETNTDFTGRFPLRIGEPVTIKGEYEYYPRGGVIHWTHRDPRFHHPAGFVEAGGTTYR